MGAAISAARREAERADNESKQRIKEQLDFLFTSVPHTDDGAISHRVEKLQLWSDFVAMVPPFLAYYGVVTANQSLVEEGYNQIKLYRNYLQDKSARGLWHHIVMGDSGTDPGHWATGKHLLLNFFFPIPILCNYAVLRD